MRIVVTRYIMATTPGRMCDALMAAAPGGPPYKMELPGRADRVNVVTRSMMRDQARSSAGCLNQDNPVISTAKNFQEKNCDFNFDEENQRQGPMSSTTSMENPKDRDSRRAEYGVTSHQQETKVRQETSNEASSTSTSRSENKGECSSQFEHEQLHRMPPTHQNIHEYQYVERSKTTNNPHNSIVVDKDDYNELIKELQRLKQERERPAKKVEQKNSAEPNRNVFFHKVTTHNKI